jgi:casein kinase 1
MASHGSSSASTANVVGVHYRVGRKIGEGSFGVIFEGASVYATTYTRRRC